MKSDLDNQINVNQIGLRSISYLKTSFRKLNNSKDFSPSQKQNTRTTIFKQNAQSFTSNNYSTAQEKEFDNPFESSNDIFPNDSFGDSKKSCSGNIVIDSNNNKGDNCLLGINTNSNSNYFSLNIDPRIDYMLKSLDLNRLTEVFYNYNMSFNDILFLTKDDCNELGLNMVQRNRLLKFNEAFQLDGKDYSYDEVVQFFKKKKKYIIKSIGKEEDYYQMTGCFANHHTSSSSRYTGNGNGSGMGTGNANGLSSICQDELINAMPMSHVYANEVFSPTDKNHEHAIWSKQIEARRFHNNNNNSNTNIIRSHLQDKIPLSNAKEGKRVNHIKEYEENTAMNTFNQIEHSTELQFSSSICNANNRFDNNGTSTIYNNNINVNANSSNKSKSSRRYNSQSHVVNSYHKMTKEIEQFMSNIASIKKGGQPVSTKHKETNKYNGVFTKNSAANTKKTANYYLSSVGQLDTANSSNYYQPKQSHHSPCPQNEVQTFDFGKSTQNQTSNNTFHRLNRNDSMTELHKFSKSSSSVDILTDCFKRKETLKTNLLVCNNKIHESKKLLKLLEDNDR